MAAVKLTVSMSAQRGAGDRPRVVSAGCTCRGRILLEAWFFLYAAAA
jgi:hypothetical protein